MDIEHIRAIADPIERARAAGAAQAYHQREIDELAVVRREAIEEALAPEDVKQIDVARQLNMTAARLSKIANGGPAPERALFAPHARAGDTVTLAVVAKRDTERHRPAVALTTHDALIRLQTCLAEFKFTAERVTVSTGGGLNFNQDHLIVMIGPRISPLIAQAISADPAIAWPQDDHGQFYLRDAHTGAEHHSDYDQVRPQPAPAPRTCYAHIGRLERPDRRGSYLYVGGIHAPGTAGAVDYLINNAPDLYAITRRNNWSAIVRVSADPAGIIQQADLATPVYVHGKSR